MTIIDAETHTKLLACLCLNGNRNIYIDTYTQHIHYKSKRVHSTILYLHNHISLLIYYDYEHQLIVRNST